MSEIEEPDAISDYSPECPYCNLQVPYDDEWADEDYSTNDYECRGCYKQFEATVHFQDPYYKTVGTESRREKQ
jgi:hypothetical protein